MKMSFALALSLLLLCGAAPLTEQRAIELWRQSEQERERRLQATQKELADAKAELRRPIGRGNKREVGVARRTRLAELERQIAALKKANDFMLPVLTDVKLGRAGMLPNNGLLEVFQVVSERAALVYLAYAHDVPYNPRGGALVKGQVQFRREEEKILVLIRGVSTNAMANGQPAQLADEPYEVTGNHKYATAAGSSNTVFVLEPIDVETVKTFRKK
jgi:hypothetical protein